MKPELSGYIYDMAVAPFNYTKAKGKWYFDGQVSYMRKYL